MALSNVLVNVSSGEGISVLDGCTVHGEWSAPWMRIGPFVRARSPMPGDSVDDLTLLVVEAEPLEKSSR